MKTRQVIFLVSTLLLPSFTNTSAATETSFNQLGAVEEIFTGLDGLATVTINGKLKIAVLSSALHLYDHDTLKEDLAIEFPSVGGPQLDSQGGGYNSHKPQLIVCHDRSDRILAYGVYHVDAIKHTVTRVHGHKGIAYDIACSSDPNKVYILEGNMQGGFIQPNLTWLIERDVRTMKVTSERSFAKCFGKISRMNPIPERAEIRSLHSVPFEPNRIIVGLSTIAYNWPLNQECPDSLGYGGGQDTELAALYFIPEKKAILGWFNPGGMSDGQQELTLFWKDNKDKWIFKELAISGTVIQAVSTLGNAVAVATDLGLYYTPDVSKPFIKITDEVGSAVLLTPKGTVIFGNEKGTLKKFALPK
jgi:hypothetical protein